MFVPRWLYNSRQLILFPCQLQFRRIENGPFSRKSFRLGAQSQGAIHLFRENYEIPCDKLCTGVVPFEFRIIQTGELLSHLFTALKGTR